MVDFFTLIGRNSVEIGIQKEWERSKLQARTVAGRPPDRPAFTTCTGATWSTNQSA